MNNIHFEKEGFEQILSKLKEKTEELNNIYNEIEEKSKSINGEDETWKGKGQVGFYKSYKTVSKKFDGIKNNFSSSNEFLQATIDSYTEKDNLIDKTINESENNFNVN
jgi:uncharacterized protein YukE